VLERLRADRDEERNQRSRLHETLLSRFRNPTLRQQCVLGDACRGPEVGNSRSYDLECARGCDVRCHIACWQTQRGRGPHPGDVCVTPACDGALTRISISAKVKRRVQTSVRAASRCGRHSSQLGSPQTRPRDPEPRVKGGGGAAADVAPVCSAPDHETREKSRPCGTGRAEASAESAADMRPAADAVLVPLHKAAAATGVALRTAARKHKPRRVRANGAISLSEFQRRSPALVGGPQTDAWSSRGDSKRDRVSEPSSGGGGDRRGGDRAALEVLADVWQRLGPPPEESEYEAYAHVQRQIARCTDSRGSPFLSSSPADDGGPD